MHHEDTSADAVLSTHQEIIAELRTQVQQQQDALSWLQQQRETWEQAARTHEKTIEELRAHAAQQHDSLVWCAEQRTRWEQAANDKDQILGELRARVRRLEEFTERTTSSGPR